MDTDDLTPMAHETLRLAHKAAEPLLAEIGAAASEFKAEDDFLRGVSAFLQELLDDPEDYLDSWALLGEVEVEAFAKKIARIRTHIETTLKTPMAKRGKPPFAK